MTPPPADPLGSSAASSTAPDDDQLVGDAGPAFDPGELPDEAPAVSAEEVDAPRWRTEQVKAFLTMQGQATHAVVGLNEQDWLYTDADLKVIAPPLTRILNRYDVTRAAAAAGDEALVAVGFGGYAMRSFMERRAAQAAAAAAAAGPRPVTGAAPDAPAPQPPGESPFGPSPFGDPDA